MNRPQPHFSPPRGRGIAFQALAALAFSAAAGFFYYRASQTPIGIAFLSYLLAALAFTLPVPFLIYGIYALRNAHYAVDRDGVYIAWGWLSEAIPMNEIVWVGEEADLEKPLPRPWPRWEGMVVGVRKAEGKRVVFYAANTRPLVVVITEERAYAISPQDVAGFLEAFRLAAEEGTLEPIPHHTQRIGGRLSELWGDRWARLLLVLGWVTTLAALAVGNLAASGIIFQSTPPFLVNRAVLLGVAALLFQGLNLGLGLFAYQSPIRKPMAYLIWLTGALSAGGFLLSGIFALQGMVK